MWGNNARPLKKNITKNENYSLKNLYYEKNTTSTSTKNYGYFGIYGRNSTAILCGTEAFNKFETGTSGLINVQE